MEISQITDDLFIGTTPSGADYDRLRELEVGLVINMRLERPPRRDRHRPPMPSLWLPTLDSPLIPIPMWALRRGVKAAQAAIEAGGRVFIHCQAGVHRSVAMAAAVLIAQGHPLQEAVERIKAGRPAADPDIWYIRRRIEKFDRLWNKP